MRIAAEFAAAKEAAYERIDRATHGALSAARAGRWIASKSDWLMKHELLDAHRKARTYLMHKRRMAALNAIAVSPPESTLNSSKGGT